MSRVDVPSAGTAAVDDGQAQRLHAASGGATWGVSVQRLGQALAASLAHRYPDGLPDDGGRAYLDSLHNTDLALAAACIDGHDGAWEHLVRELRPQLYHAARTIAGDDGRELADSLYADLFGIPGAEGRRRSLLAYYHGRSRLLTWMRSVLVQRHIDRHRAARRLEPLDEQDPPSTAPAAEPDDPERAPLVGQTQRAIDTAIDGMAPQDRLRLRLYYGQDMTLAAIGRVLGEHEATVSRKLEKARKTLRRDVELALEAQGLNRDQVTRAFELAAEAPELRLDRLLVARSNENSVPPVGR
jgi:RNA polymerase sigma-70 factor (ECF subfamily)